MVAFTIFFVVTIGTICAFIKNNDNYWCCFFKVRLADGSRVCTQLSLTHISKYLHHRQHLHATVDEGNYTLFPGIPRESIDLSHLCHNPECVNPNHLILEPQCTNLSRNQCVKQGFCLGHRIKDIYNISLPCCLLKHRLNESVSIKFDDRQPLSWPRRKAKTIRNVTREDIRYHVEPLTEQEEILRKQAEKQYYAQNREMLLQRQKRYREQNREKKKLYNAKHREQRRQYQKRKREEKRMQTNSQKKPISLST